MQEKISFCRKVGVKGECSMKDTLRGNWNTSIKPVAGFSYTCGYCGSIAGPSLKYQCSYSERNSTFSSGNIYICPTCNKPTFIKKFNEEQIPGPIIGASVNFLPENIEQLYNEARKCLTVNAFTSTVLSCRKLLMNISVSKGADSGKNFAYYVSFLEDNHFIPPNSRDWVDHIRKKGNEATHEIPSIGHEDAVELLEFTEMLLRFVYELPGRMAKHTNK
jgi:Domain of unknown function (DUF4145)